MDRIIELGLSRRRKSDSGDATVKLADLVVQLLRLVSDNTQEGDNPRSAALRSQLEECRHKVMKENGAEIAESAAYTGLIACHELFRLSQTRRMERDEQFAEVIEFLRRALASFAGSSKAFHKSLLGTSDRLSNLSGIVEIQELKRRITEEVKVLKQVVHERQKQETVQTVQLSERVSILQQKLQRAREEASLDGLTGIANRRSFDQALQHWVDEHQATEQPFALALLDLDDFKKINDGFGHQVGDQILAYTGQELARSFRVGDFIARYGGEEFVILLDGIRLHESEARMSKLIQQVAATRVECRKGDEPCTVSFTMSCGVAEYALGEKPEDLISRADAALYEAKMKGKNRAVSKRRPLLGAFYEGRKRNPRTSSLPPQE
jgi:diguanylate cyclase